MPKIASVVTTYNRPDQLAKTLPQVAALGAPVLVVDDGSASTRNGGADVSKESLAWANLRAIRASGVDDFLMTNKNRGLAAALNIGLSYWLADPSVEFISVFQDDCDVSPHLHDVMLEVCTAFHSESTNVFTGFDAVEHPKGPETLLKGAGITFYPKQTGGGVHLFARRRVWQSLMPIPSLGLGLPANGKGSGVDFYLTKSTGTPLFCVPGLVSHRAWKAEDSTWGSRRVKGEDPPLDDSAIAAWKAARP